MGLVAVAARAEGFEALEFAAGRTFFDGERPADGDCLILDLTMPGMNGFEVLAELRRRGDTLPVIIVTAYADPATRSRAAAGGAARPTRSRLRQ